MQAESNSELLRKDVKLVRVAWPEMATPALFANNMLVQRDESTVYISFYQFNQPIIMADNDEDRKKAIEAVDHINAIPVARMAFPVQKTEALIEALRKQIIPEEGGHE